MTVKTALNRENNNLDLTRIMLASFVIFGHTIGANGFTRFYFDPLDRFMPNSCGIHILAVRVFFFISGLVVSNSLLQTKNLIRFATSRFFRIMPGFLFLLFITAFVICPFMSNLSISQYFRSIEVYKYIVFNAIFTGYKNLPGVFYRNTNDLKNIVNGSLWSLTYEVQCYIALFMVFLGSKKIFAYSYSIICYSLILLVLCTSFLHIHNERAIPFFFFALGGLFALYQDKIKLNLLIAVCLFILYFIVRNSGFGVIMFIVFFCYSLFLLSTSRYFIRLKVKHDISYGIYLWGYLIQQSLFFLFGHFEYNLVFFLISLSLAITMGFLSFIFIEKPGIEYGKRFSIYLSDRFTKLKQ